ncbi:ulp1 protease family, C-terminal catalytic domain-containing protein [Tanacetum coccineum]
MRHIADSLQWRNIDNEFKEFGNEVRNIRFGLSSDGINPFGNMSSRHSTWPVLLCIYNLPQWLCMKMKFNHDVMVKEPKSCMLFSRYTEDKKPRARGMVYPIGDGTIHAGPLLPYYMKVSIDSFVPAFGGTKLPVPSKADDTNHLKQKPSVDWHV